MRKSIVSITAGLIAVAVFGFSAFSAFAETPSSKKPEEIVAPLKQLAPGTVFTFAIGSGGTAKVKIKKMEGASIFEETGSASEENVGFGVTFKPEREK